MKCCFGDITVAKGNVIESSLQRPQHRESVGRRDRGKSEIRVHHLAVCGGPGEQDETVWVLSHAVERIMKFMRIKADHDDGACGRSRREQQRNYDSEAAKQCLHPFAFCGSVPQKL